MSARPNSKIPETKTEVVDPLADPGYEQLIDKLPAKLFLSRQWLQVLKDTYQFKPEAIMLCESGAPAACIPFVRISDPGGSRVCALSFSDYCDPAFSDASQTATAFEKLKNLDPVCAVNLRLLDSPDPPKNLGFKKIKTARWHGLDLSPGLDRLKARIDPTFRRAVQKARKAGLKVRKLEHNELRIFFEFHLRVRKNRYRLLAQPFSFFENIWQAFMAKGAGYFLGAFLDGDLIAAHCYIPWKQTLVFKFGASDYNFQQMRANNLLHWSAVEDAAGSGFTSLDLGLSDDDQPGLITYKRHLGAIEKEIRFFNFTPKDFAAAPGWKEGLKNITDAATAPDVPDLVTEETGNIFYRFFA
jgi:CelD/BcsL family acetyltransferase involved in cellulose biosynthesis